VPTFITIILAVACISLSSPHVQAVSEPAPTIRFSISPEKVRVVVDLPVPSTFTDRSTPGKISVMLATPLASALPPILIPDGVVSGVTLSPDAAGQAVLTIALARPRKFEIFTLPPLEDKPFRLVIDVFKRFTQEICRTLSPAITHTRLERQMDEQYLAVHFVEVNLRDPQVRINIANAQGERERVAAMVTRTGAVCGVNGGYFLAGTRPVGLLKVDGQLFSLPLWGRTALGIAADGQLRLGNPTGVWRLTLPDGTSREVPDQLDASTSVPAPTAIIIAGMNFSRTPENPAGISVRIRDNQIVERSSSALTLLPGDVALVLKAGDALLTAPTLEVGMPITLTPEIDPTWAPYPSAVGAGPRLLRGGRLEITGAQERFKPDILQGRAARTGLGVTAEGKAVITLVEAPGLYGGGATLEELARLLQSRGAVEAMNFDGGGSSHLAIGAQTVSAPPEAWLRPVASAVLIFDPRVPPATMTAASSPDAPLP
jgi:hypothetical protein